MKQHVPGQKRFGLKQIAFILLGSILFLVFTLFFMISTELIDITESGGHFDVVVKLFGDHVGEVNDVRYELFPRGDFAEQALERLPIEKDLTRSAQLKDDSFPVNVTYITAGKFLYYFETSPEVQLSKIAIQTKSNGTSRFYIADIPKRASGGFIVVDLDQPISERRQTEPAVPKTAD